MKNSIHCMDENGYYEGYMDFSVLIDTKKAEAVRIMFHTNSFYRNKYVWSWKDPLWFMFGCLTAGILKNYKRPYYLKWDIQ